MLFSETSPPPLLTEADLIALMEKHGIGTECSLHVDKMKFIQENMLGCWRTSFSFNLTEYDLHLSFIKNTALSPKVLKNCQNCQILSICHIRAICSCMVWFFISGETNACITRNYSLLCFAIFRNRCDSCRAHRDNQNKNVHRGKQRWPFRSWSAGDGTGRR